MPKPICVPCARFYRPKRNGFPIIENMPVNPGAPAGRAGEGQWVPYKLWQADLWECPECGHQIVTGYGAHPLAEHYQPSFAADVKTYAPTLKINDC